MTRKAHFSVLLVPALLAVPVGAADALGPTDVEGPPAPPSLATLTPYLESLTGDWEGPPLIDGIPLGMRLEGDMIVPEGLPLAGSTPNAWPEGVVYFQFDANVSASNRLKALAAMNAWVYSNANVTFVPRGDESNYVHIRASNSGNNSLIGMAGGQQIINVESWNSKFIIAHEYGHALGFFHEQSRPDRNDYVQINWENICCGATGNFDLEANWLTLGTPYDFDSVMHYDECAFSECSFCGPVIGCQTIEVLPEHGNQDIGQRNHLSANDVIDMADVYGAGGAPIFVDYQSTGDPDGTVLAPLSSFDLAAAVVVPGETIWIRSASYPRGASVYQRPAVWRTYGGPVLIQ